MSSYLVTGCLGEEANAPPGYSLLPESCRVSPWITGCDSSLFLGSSPATHQCGNAWAAVAGGRAEAETAVTLGCCGAQAVGHRQGLQSPWAAVGHRQGLAQVP